MKTDKFQKRYIDHQKRKRTQLIQIFNERVSQRIFNGEKISDSEMAQILESIAKVPSSCSRQAIYGKVIDGRDQKELLGAFLVGGVGWVHRADKIILLFASRKAYKAGNEIEFMPFLDAGVVLMACYFICESLKIGTCFVNPNIREKNKPYFSDNFNEDNDVFCGAIAIGKYDTKTKANLKKKNITLK